MSSIILFQGPSYYFMNHPFHSDDA